ncbi:MAG: hypothetical protein A2Y20_01250 [Firmicutes bacterium GWF2_51_9]|nr:MAG: hypothetical protein A2Y20_01250 [Firmicutes bacterium GWF2_51_9]OGS58360.1 MAG: hypothetical protein A2Y19_08605 [Firmicutes bacterium GWE2_51_13]HAM64161.1 hypothetical protein [Erysipelotrichaceae bacterium]HBZ40784.1 hypothetical protein [Erysipelotrichaceae bacterium]
MKKDKILLILYVVLNLLILSIIGICNQNFNLVTYFSLLQIILSILLISHVNKRFLSIPIIFLSLSYLFHFGQSIIISFGFNDVYAYKSVFSTSSLGLYMQAEYFAMVSHFFVTIGLVNGKQFLHNYMQFKKEDRKSLSRIATIALIVISVSILPMLYLDFIKLLAVINSGYLSTYDTYMSGINKYLSFFAQFARPAIAMLLISHKNDTKRATILYVFASLYLFLVMLSGDRSTNMIYFITYSFIYFRLVKELKLKTILVLAVGGYFLLGFVSTISVFRDGSSFTLDSFIYYFRHRSNDGVFYSILREFGGTIKTLVYSIRFTPSYSNYNFGLTYILSWFGVLPKLPDFLSEFLIIHFTFTRSFPATYQGSLGGSYLGELYYNFGWLGCIMSVIVGYFIGSVNNLAEFSIKKKDWLILSLIMVLFPSIILWVRGYFVELLFKFFWLSLFSIYLYKYGERYAIFRWILSKYEQTLKPQGE